MDGRGGKCYWLSRQPPFPLRPATLSTFILELQFQRFQMSLLVAQTTLYSASNRKMIVNAEVEITWNEAVGDWSGPILALGRRKWERPQKRQSTQYRGQDSNQTPPKYERRELPLCESQGDIGKSFLRFLPFFFLWRYSPNLGLGLPPWNSQFHFGFLDLRHSVGLLGRVISSSQGFYMYKNTEKRTHTNTKHPCPEWDSNPRSRFPSEWRQSTP
jgi:hypothetical protein